MITPASTEQPIEVFGSESTMDFALDPAATAHILNMLRSGIYKDSIMACIREYWCNARDSVVEAGKNPAEHVTIVLPNEYDAHFKIKDEGLGLSEADFRRIFRKYGASTKRDSNETIGCLGIGSKSAFSYSDTYSVTAIKNGVKRVFVCSVARNSVASDGIGNINRMLEIDTDEPNGVEICIPVKAADFYTFKTKTLHFLSFIPEGQRPKVRGVQQQEVDIPVRSGDFKGDNWTLTAGGSSYAIMGGVPYNLDVRSMDKLTQEEKALVQLGVDVTFPIGAFEFAISREEMRYTDLSQQSIKVELQKILQTVTQTITDKYKSPKSLWEAKWFYREVWHSGGTTQSRFVRQVLNQDRKSFIRWDGQPVTSYAFHFSTNVNAYTCYLGYLDVVEKSSRDSINVENTTPPAIIIHDSKTYGEWQRVKTALLKHRSAVVGIHTSVVLIRVKDQTKTQEVLKEIGIDALPYTFLSAYERDRTNSKVGVKYSTTFEYSDPCATTPYPTWTAEDVDIEAGGVYLPLKRGMEIDNTINHRSLSIHDIQNMKNALAAIGKPVDAICGFRQRALDKINPNKWKNFIAHFIKVLGDYLIENKVFASDQNRNKYMDILQGSVSKINFRYCFHQVEKIIPLIYNPDSVFIDHWKARAEADATSIQNGNRFQKEIDAYRLISDTSSLQYVPTEPSNEIREFEAYSAQFAAKYPMLALLVNWENSEVIAKYINEKDA